MFSFIGRAFLARSSHTEDKSFERRAFEHFLRTGRRLVRPRSSAPESKFNPYHDPRNGRFTFAPGGPQSLRNPVFSNRRGLWKPKDKTPGSTPAGSPTGPPKNTPAEPRAGRAGSSPTGRAASPAVGDVPADELNIHVPVAPRAAGSLLRVSASDDGAEHANCPEGGNCRATVTVTPRDSNDVEIAINEYRRFVRDSDWRDNDFQNLVDMRRTFIALRQKEAIALRIANWDPTKLLPEKWIAESIVDLALDDPDDLIGAVAYYLTLGIDGPGPRPELVTLENLMNPQAAALAQAEWARKELIHQSYQALMGSDPIFASTAPVDVSGKRAIDKSNPYEVGVRGLYGGKPDFRAPDFDAMLDGNWVVGRADYVTVVDGKETAIDAKFTRLWSESLRNPSGRIGDMHFSAKAQRDMIDQARKYESAYPGGAIYHTNNVEFARFYTALLHRKGVTNFHFVITPSR